QAEDGIRDGHVTGVQTCALPIYDFPQEDVGEGPEVPDRLKGRGHRREGVDHEALGLILLDLAGDLLPEGGQALRGRSGQLEKRRSEERRVGKECRARRWPSDWKK